MEELVDGLHTWPGLCSLTGAEKRVGNPRTAGSGSTGQFRKVPGRGVVMGCLYLKPVRFELTPLGGKFSCHH